MRKWSDFVSETEISSDFIKELPIMAIYGKYQIGKSTLLNCLLGKYIALTGKGVATTALASRYRYGEAEVIRYRTKPESNDGGNLRKATLEQIRDKTFIKKIDLNSGFHIETETNSRLLKYCSVVDTPGYDAFEQDNSVAINALEHVNYVLFVLPNRGLSLPEKELLLKLKKADVEISILMNCCLGRREERWIPENVTNTAYQKECECWLDSANIQVTPILGQKVYLCNFLFYWSQMDGFRDCLQDIDRADTVIKHIQETLKDEDYPTDRETIISLSCVAELITDIENKVKGYNPLTHRIGRSS